MPYGGVSPASEGIECRFLFDNDTILFGLIAATLSVLAIVGIKSLFWRLFLRPGKTTSP